MATPNEKLAASLDRLRALQRDGRRVFQSNKLGRTHRERLIAQGFLREIIKGWLISTGPGAGTGDSTPWYASFWEFCARYCGNRFGADWHLSPEQSVLLHAGSTVIPPQVVVYSPKGTNNTIELLFGTSLYDLRQKQMPAADDLIMKEGLQLFSPTASLLRVPEDFFTRYPIEVQVLLSGIKDPSDLLGRLLNGGHSFVAGRLAGALRRIGRTDFADEIVKAMKVAGYDVRESDPFAPERNFIALTPGIPPIVGRIKVIWAQLRGDVIALFPKRPGLPQDKGAYLRFVEDIYKSDAYHSLSIEGYSVTPELIERVRAGNWDPEKDAADRQNRDALAARGYWQAFQLVEIAVSKIIAGEDPGKIAHAAHRDWYRELFQPSVAAGLVPAATLAGYRTQPVYLRGSRHVPPNWAVVPDAMSTLFELIETEPDPSVRAILGHWLIGHIHPYPDGNGRIARFFMNAMLASGGYPWTVIRVDDRTDYLQALEAASIDLNIKPFTAFVAKRVLWSTEQDNNGPPKIANAPK